MSESELTRHILKPARFLARFSSFSGAAITCRHIFEGTIVGLEKFVELKASVISRGENLGVETDENGKNYSSFTISIIGLALPSYSAPFEY